MSTDMLVAIDRGGVPQLVGGHQNSGTRLSGLAQFMTIERAHLLPVELQHPVRKIGYRHLQRVIRTCSGMFSMQCSISAINVASL